MLSLLIRYCNQYVYAVAWVASAHVGLCLFLRSGLLFCFDREMFRIAIAIGKARADGIPDTMADGMADGIADAMDESHFDRGGGMLARADSAMTTESDILAEAAFLLDEIDGRWGSGLDDDSATDEQHRFVSWDMYNPCDGSDVDRGRQQTCNPQLISRFCKTARLLE